MSAKIIQCKRSKETNDFSFYVDLPAVDYSNYLTVIDQDADLVKTVGDLIALGSIEERASDKKLDVIWTNIGNEKSQPYIGIIMDGSTPRILRIDTHAEKNEKGIEFTLYDSYSSYKSVSIGHCKH